jgi:hypothetical protein
MRDDIRRAISCRWILPALPRGSAARSTMRDSRGTI